MCAVQSTSGRQKAKLAGLTCCAITLLAVRGEDNEMATENAVAALGKVLEFHGSVIEGSAAAQSWDVWISSLPLVEDKVEARHVHAQLVRHIQASDARCTFSPLRNCAASYACGNTAFHAL